MSDHIHAQLPDGSCEICQLRAELATLRDSKEVKVPQLTREFLDGMAFGLMDAAHFARAKEAELAYVKEFYRRFSNALLASLSGVALTTGEP
jgi:hypothetical protein